MTKDAFYPFLSEISSSPHGDPPPAFVSKCFWLSYAVIAVYLFCIERYGEDEYIRIFLFQAKDEHKYVYIFRDDLYWACIMGNGRLTEQCGHMLITDSLCQLHRVCSTLCGTITQHSITSNLTLIAEVVQETMVKFMCNPYVLLTNGVDMQVIEFDF